MRQQKTRTSLASPAVSVVPDDEDPADAVLAVLTTIRDTTAVVADATIALLTDQPTNSNAEQLVALATRGRGLLAHGTGWLTIHAIGRQLGIDHDGDTTTALRQLLQDRARPPSTKPNTTPGTATAATDAWQAIRQ